MKKNIFRLMVLASLLLLCTPVLFADSSVNQDVVITVASYSTLSLQDSSVAVECTSEGSFTGFSHYKVSSNNTNSKKVSAQITAVSALGQPGLTDIPTGMTLSVSLDAYGSGVSEGLKVLSKTSSVDLVTGLLSSSSAFGESGWIDVDYTVDITEAVLPDDYTVTVTYTLTEV